MRRGKARRELVDLGLEIGPCGERLELGNPRVLRFERGLGLGELRVGGVELGLEIRPRRRLETADVHALRLELSAKRFELTLGLLEVRTLEHERLVSLGEPRGECRSLGDRRRAWRRGALFLPEQPVEVDDVGAHRVGIVDEGEVFWLGKPGVRGTYLPLAALDLAPEPGAKTVLLRHLDAELLHERGRQLWTGNELALDEHLAEALAALRLDDECLLELVSRDQAVFDEQLTEQARGNTCGFHE